MLMIQIYFYLINKLETNFETTATILICLGVQLKRTYHYQFVRRCSQAVNRRGKKFMTSQNPFWFKLYISQVQIM